MATENRIPRGGPWEAPRIWRRGGRTGQHGTKDQLVRAGVPEAWLSDLPAPGKKRGFRTLFDRGAEVYVSVGERGVFYVQTNQLAMPPHVDERRGAAFARFIEHCIGVPAEGA